MWLLRPICWVFGCVDSPHPNGLAWWSHCPVCGRNYLYPLGMRNKENRDAYQADLDDRDA